MSERDESSAGWVPDHPGLVLRNIGKTYYTVNVLNGVN